MPHLCHLVAALSCCLRLLKAVSADGTLCYRDKNPANTDPYNMYMCEDGTKQICCREGDLDTCCDYDPTQRTILQQTTIWGLLVATMVGLIFIYLCCFRSKNNSGTEIRSPDEQKRGCGSRIGSNCCPILSPSNKDDRDNTRYRQSGEI